MNKSRAGRSEPTDALADIAEQIRSISLENQQLFQRLVDSEHRFRGLAHSVWQVQEEERRRLARELHDSIGQTLVGLIHQVERLAGRIGADGPSDLAAEVQALARQALDETRELSRLLRPPVLDDLGLEAALSWLVRVLGERTDLHAELDTDLGGRRLSVELETLVFRVVQEALNNAIKHAPGAPVSVRLSRRNDRLRLQVEDEGPGFDAEAVLAAGHEADGSGLRGIHDRVELFGGECDIASRPGEGARLSIALPVRDADLAQ